MKRDAKNFRKDDGNINNKIGLVDVATIPTLVFLTPLLLPDCHNSNRFVVSSLAPMLYFFILSYFDRVDGVEIKDATAVRVFHNFTTFDFCDAHPFFEWDLGR